MSIIEAVFNGQVIALSDGTVAVEGHQDATSLHAYQRRLADVSAELRRQRAVRSFLAHDMPVTRSDLGQVAGVVCACREYGIGLFCAATQQGRLLSRTPGSRRGVDVGAVNSRA